MTVDYDGDARASSALPTTRRGRLAKREAIWIPAVAIAAYCVIAVAGVAVGFHITAGELGRPGGLGPSLFRWDAHAYLSIAQHGYNLGGASFHGNYAYNAAFFPGYALIELGLNWLFSTWSPLVMIVPSFLFGILSVVAFSQLAGHFFTGRALALSTLGFALYPGASFMIAAYPVTALNLCVILLLLGLVRRHPWRAAFWGGLGTLFGPLGVIAALTVPLYWLVDLARSRRRGSGRPSRRAIARRTGELVALLALDLFGLVAFAVYQWVVLGTPLGMVKAQSHWGQVSPLEIIARVVTLYPLRVYYGHPWIGPPGNPPFNGLEIYLQCVGSIVAMGVIFALLLAQRQFTPWYFTGLGALVLVAYYIGTAAIVGPVAGFRLLDIATPAFLGLGAMARVHWRSTVGLVGLFAGALLIQVALTAAGYYVV